MSERNCEIAILGGGLAGGQIAAALTRLRFELHLMLIARAKRFGGRHVWFFFVSHAARDPDSGPARAGARAERMHPLTSFPLPGAVRFAPFPFRQICRLPNLSDAVLAAASYERVRAHWRRGSFYRMLTRMLFGSGEPQHRFRLPERFCCQPEPVVERFCDGRTSSTDALRIHSGRPPVPLAVAVARLAGVGHPLDRTA
jgi:hypothetical protein